MRLLTLVVGAVLVPAQLAAGLTAQGSQYRGPCDLEPLTEMRPLPGIPVRGGPMPPPQALVRPGPIGPGNGGGILVVADLTRFEFFWELQKDHWLDARASRPPLDPELLRDRVIPALWTEFGRADDRGRSAASMIALAKLGRDIPESDLVDALRARTRDPDGHLRGVALVALGLTGRAAAIGTLTGAARTADTPAERTHACWGLGLCGARLADETARSAILRTLRSLAADREVDDETRVAAMHGLATVQADDVEQDTSLRVLDAIWRATDAPPIVRAQVPVISAHLGTDPEARRRRVARWLAAVGDADEPEVVRHAALVGIGWAMAGSGDATTARILFADLALTHSLRGAVTIALARVGGPIARSALLAHLTTGNKALDWPWAAIALGVLAQARANAGKPPDLEIRERLRASLAATKQPSTRAALAFGLALAGDREAAPMLRELLQKNEHQDELAGNLSIALALLEPQGSDEDTIALLARSTRRPIRLAQVALAVGEIGGGPAVDALLDCLDASNWHAVAAVARGLGAIRDPRAVEPLLRILGDDSLPDLMRAHASIALGCLADPAPRPWNADLAARIAWRAFPASAFTLRSGILTWL